MTEFAARSRAIRPPMDSQQTMTRLREIEARIAGKPGATDAEVLASIRAQLARARASGKDVVTTIDVPDVLLLDLFFLLSDRYGIEGGLASKRAQRSVTVLAPRAFIETILGPIYRESAKLLFEHLIAQMHALIQETYGMRSAASSVSLKPL